MNKYKDNIISIFNKMNNDKQILEQTLETKLNENVNGLQNIISENTNKVQMELIYKEDKSEKGIANGYAPLDQNTKLPLENISDVILGQMLYAGTFNPINGEATLTTNGVTKLSASSNKITLTNDITLITGYKANQGNYYLVSNTGTFADISFDVGDWIVATNTKWEKIDNTDAVVSVAGKIGAVTLSKSDVGLANVDNTSDANKPISTATQTSLDKKANSSHTHTIAEINNLQSTLNSLQNQINGITTFGTYVAVKNNSFMISNDGINWSQNNSFFGNWKRLHYENNNKRFYMDDGNTFTWSNTNFNWNSSSFESDFLSGRTVKAHNNGYIILSDGSSMVTGNSDNYSWFDSYSYSEFTNANNMIKIGNYIYVLCNNSIWGQHSSYIDYGNWIKYSSLSGNWQNGAFGNNIYVLVNGSNTITRSINGTTWSSISVPTGTWKNIAYGNGKFIATGGTNNIIYSIDGSTWISATLPTGNWSAICFGKDKFVILGNSSSAALYSQDGLNWFQVTLSSGGWTEIAYGV